MRQARNRSVVRSTNEATLVARRAAAAAADADTGAAGSLANEKLEKRR